VHLSQVEAGETRIVTLEVQAEAYWQREGTIEAAAGDSNTPPDVAVDVSTFLIP